MTVGESFLVILHFRISNITMETAVEAGDGSEVSGDMARSIESCICPTGYTGLSCQVSLTWFLFSHLLLLTCSSSPAPLRFLCRTVLQASSTSQCLSCHLRGSWRCVRVFPVAVTTTVSAVMLRAENVR